MHTEAPKKHPGRPSHIPAGWIERPEVAAMLGVQLVTVSRWEASGRLPEGKRWGNLKLWNKDGMERFVKTLDVADYARKEAA